MRSRRGEACLARGVTGVFRLHRRVRDLGATTRRRARLAFPPGGLALLVLLLLGPPSLHAQIRGVVLEDTRPGRAAPALELPQLTATGVSPQAYELARELGLVVVLSFCPSLADEGCQGVWRGWQDAGQVFGGGVSVVGVTGDSVQAGVALAAQAGLRGRFLSDAGGRETRRWGVRSPVPGQAAVFVISPEGRIEYRDLQYDPLDSAAWGRLWQAVARVRMPARP